MGSYGTESGFQTAFFYSLPRSMAAKFFRQSADALRGIVESGQMALDGGNQCLVAQAEQGGIAAETARTDFSRAEADLQLVARVWPVPDIGWRHRS